MFKQVVIYGYPLHSHTHSYIHSSFKKAFDHLGFNTFWLTDSDNLSGINFDNTLFFAAGEQEKNIPLNKSSHYVLHNVNSKKYLDAGCKVFTIQVHTNQIPTETSLNCERIDKCTLLEKGNTNCLYMAWATDLLPHEINLSDATNQLSDKYCFWAGTYGDSVSTFQNGTELMPYFDLCKKNGIDIKAINPWSKPISDEENRNFVKNSYLAPAIQGPWQIEKEYIPCRIFKNISYGSLGITNNTAVNSLFDNMLVYDRDPVALFNKSVESKKDPRTLEKIKYLMNEVKMKHTYLNRIEVILNCMGLSK
jgi:hypothetical protein